MEVTQPAWVQGLNVCLQLIVIDHDDIEIEMGQVEHGELRARAFPQLQKTLTDEQTLAFGWMALADIACWPQLQPPEAFALAQTIQSVAPQLPARSANGRTPRDAGYRAAAAILAFIAQAQARLAWSDVPKPSFEPIRVAINGLAHLQKNRVAFWEQWLRRVVESAATTTPEDACACALAALKHTIPLPARFEYEATRFPGLPPSNTNGPFNLSVVVPRAGGKPLMSLGQVTGLDPKQRKLEAIFTPSVSIDRYRMAYLVRTVCMSNLLDDVKVGYFDQATITNASTGETWRYSAT
jgi:hypothetical protein